MARNSNNFVQGSIDVSMLKNPGKYIAKKLIDGKPMIVFRSSWEKSFISYCDRNPNVISWSSEEYEIKYAYSIDGRTHRYFPDFWIKVKTDDGSIKEFIVEIKPLKETIEPQHVLTEGMSERTKKDIIETYVKNRDKWIAAESFCRKKSMGFKLLTEKDILFVKRQLKSL